MILPPVFFCFDEKIYHKFRLGEHYFLSPVALQKSNRSDRIGKERKKPTAFADKQRGREIFLGKFREIFLFREGEGRMTKKEKVTIILELLHEHYGPTKCYLDHESTLSDMKKSGNIFLRIIIIFS